MQHLSRCVGKMFPDVLGRRLRNRIPPYSAHRYNSRRNSGTGYALKPDFTKHEERGVSGFNVQRLLLGMLGS